MALRELFFARDLGFASFCNPNLWSDQVVFSANFSKYMRGRAEAQKTVLRVQFIADILGLRHFVALIRTLIKFFFHICIMCAMEG